MKNIIISRQQWRANSKEESEKKDIRIGNLTFRSLPTDIKGNISGKPRRKEFVKGGRKQKCHSCERIELKRIDQTAVGKPIFRNSRPD